MSGVVGRLPFVAVMEACPPHLRHREDPCYGGSLFYNTETGLAGCVRCGWSGIPTITGGRVTRIVRWCLRLVPAEPEEPVMSTWCPACQHEPDPVFNAQRVARNAPCPCGSGVKAKKCDCAQFTV